MRNYPAKLLLFGEHVLLLGASALAVPVPAFSGQWSWEKEHLVDYAHREIVLQFIDSKALQAIAGLDIKRLKQDIEAGLIFHSNIPTGYGLGSSGALCAGIYDRYVTEKTADTAELKLIFGQMESFFHGASSGIDPLTSYLNAPLLIRHKTKVSIAAMRPWQEPPLVFLIDTKTPRQTGPLVQWFLEQNKQNDFSEQLTATYLPAHEAMLSAWTAADAANFWLHLRRVSQFQLAHFHPMIPENMRSIWEQSFDNQHFNLKICGAGGGGFMLGFARNRDVLKEISDTFPVILPFENNKDM